MYNYVRDIHVSFVSTILPMNFGTVPTVWYFPKFIGKIVEGGSGLFDVYYVSIKLKQKVPHRPKKKYHTVGGKKYHIV
jgi:hypothetical protein